MKHRHTIHTLGSALAILVLMTPSYAQSRKHKEAQPKTQEATCCCQGMGNGPGMGGMHRRGRNRNQAGKPMQGMDSDMMTAHQLVMLHERVQRTVKQLPDGVETLTESKDADVIAKIKEHVPAMYRRLKEKRPLHQVDPLFRELFRYGSQIKAEVTITPQGVRVIETSTDPYVVRLIKAHAKSVDALVERGMAAMHERHDVPKR